MWEIIRKNKIKSAIALIIMTVWYSVVYGLICGFFAFAIFCKIFGEDIAGSISWYVYYIIGCIISFIIFYSVFMNEKNKPYQIPGFEIKKTDNLKCQRLYNISEEIALASGLKTLPKMYILDSNILNAYACGLNPKNSSIVVSKGLLKVLSRDELQGVIAHEMSHIINRDTMYLLCSGIMLGISASFTCGFYEDVKRGGRGAIVSFVFMLISFIGQVVCFILFMFISRKREYLADACACQYTRYPKGLADALLKIEKSYDNSKYIYTVDKNANYLVRASFIVPIKEQKDSITSTHPSTQNRIKVLLNMKTADYIAYEKEFEALNGKKIIPKSACKNAKTLQIKKNKTTKQNEKVVSACALYTLANGEEIQTIKENRNTLEENIKKHREIEDMVHDLSGFIMINCECGTKLKIPPVYINTIVICPHCKKRHVINAKAE